MEWKIELSKYKNLDEANVRKQVGGHFINDSITYSAL